MKNDNNFLQTVLTLASPGVRVLDLGAGSGHFSIMFAERGVQVTAIDVKLPADLPSNITRHQMSVEEYIVQHGGREQFDIVFMRNVLQFLDKKWVCKILLPGLARMLTPEGVIAIETFHAQPDPSFDVPVRSLYYLNELKEQPKSWTILYEREYHKDRPDMRGMTRHFYITQIIVRQSPGSTAD